MGTKMQLSIIRTAIVAAACYALLLMGAFAGPLLARPVLGAVPLSFLVAWAVSAMDRSGRRPASLQEDCQATGGMRA